MLPATPFWAMLATFTVSPVAGIAATIKTSTLACQYHTVDACIPALEGLFGVVVAGTVFIWLAASNRRRRSITSGLGLAAAATVIWLITMVALGPMVCPDRNANDVIGPLALPLGVIVFAVAGVLAWWLQEPVGSATSRPDSGDV